MLMLEWTKIKIQTNKERIITVETHGHGNEYDDDDGGDVD